MSEILIHFVPVNDFKICPPLTGTIRNLIPDYGAGLGNCK